ncbi:unnamed protein product [Merluccius merluccius]
MNHLVRASARCLRPASLLWRRAVPVVPVPVVPVGRFLSAATDMQQTLGEMVKKDKVVVFIKGTPAQPMCGFSNAVIQILRMHGVEDYAAYNVLDDQDLRQGIKEFSNWPTIPQVYINSEFLGGCDILLQMHQNGDLVEELNKLGIRSALVEAETESK